MTSILLSYLSPLCPLPLCIPAFSFCTPIQVCAPLPFPFRGSVSNRISSADQPEAGSQAKCIEVAAAAAAAALSVCVCACVCACIPEIPQTDTNMQITRQRDRKGDEKKRETRTHTQTMEKGLGSPGASLVFTKVPPRERMPLFWFGGVWGIERWDGRGGKDGRRRRTDAEKARLNISGRRV